MKKLIILMIFVLLFSITIVAGELSKEEIIAELGRIVTVTNRDNRLEMYDSLSGKLGLKVADETIINEFFGNGMKTTRPFITKTSWEIQWDAKDDGTGITYFGITLFSEDGSPIGIIANQSKPGKGSFYSPKKGKYYLSINAMGNWEIKIIAVE